MVEEKILPGKYIYVSAKIKAYAGYYVRAPFQWKEAFNLFIIKKPSSSYMDT